MTHYTSDLLKTLNDRGYIFQGSEMSVLDQKAANAPITAYIGFDCTAPSLHVGSLVQIMMLRILQKAGHKPIVLMGGGTTKVGDPSGKDESRKMLTDADIDANLAGIKQVFSKFLTFGDGKTDAIMVNNDDWLKEINYISFLRDYGKHFSVNRMMAFDSVKLRLEREQNLSFLEFNYMILQAYDFVELFRRYGCTVQMGGSDQWGNIINGVDLGRRTDNAQLFALTSPLITTSSGAKMGKTAAGAVWLDESRVSVFDYWQFWRNTEDKDVGRFLKLFTELPLDEIARLEALQGAHINDAKRILATEATALLHGREAAQKAEAAAANVFAGNATEDLPTITLSKEEIGDGIGILSLFVKAGLQASTSEARRSIQGGALRVNDEPITNEKQTLNAGDFTQNVKLSVGKKKHVLVKLG